MMQARITATAFGAIASLVFLTQCSTKGSFSWPTSNPFASAKDQSFEELARERGVAPIRIAFTGNILGESEPCGCAVGPKGGLDRRLNFLRREVVKGPYPSLIVDAGNTLFPSLPVDPARQAEFRTKALALLRSQDTLGVDVQNVGRIDLALGVDFLKAAPALKTKLVSANWANAADRKLVFPSHADVTLKDGRVVTITGLSAGDSEHPIPGLITLDPTESLKSALAAIPADRIVVVLSDLGSVADSELGRAIKRQLIIVGSRDMGSQSLPDHDGNSVIVQSAFRGQQWGLIDVAVASGSNGWYNAPEGKRFYDHWKNLEETRARDLKRPDGAERKVELARHDEVAKDIEPYMPGDLKRKSIYRHALYDLHDAFAGANELTKVMAELRKIR